MVSPRLRHRAARRNRHRPTDPLPTRCPSLDRKTLGIRKTAGQWRPPPLALVSSCLCDVGRSTKSARCSGLLRDHPQTAAGRRISGSLRFRWGIREFTNPDVGRYPGCRKGLSRIDTPRLPAISAPSDAERRRFDGKIEFSAKHRNKTKRISPTTDFSSTEKSSPVRDVEKSTYPRRTWSTSNTTTNGAAPTSAVALGTSNGSFGSDRPTIGE